MKNSVVIYKTLLQKIKNNKKTEHFQKKRNLKKFLTKENK